MQAVELTTIENVDSDTTPEGRLRPWERLYDDWELPALMLLAFVIPLKLSFSLVCYFAILIAWLCRHYRDWEFALGHSAPLTRPLLAFCLVSLLCAPFGIAPRHSLSQLLFFSYPMFLIPLFGGLRSVSKVCYIVTALLAGQFVSSLHSYIDVLLPLPSLFIGKVTESGQLAIAIPLALSVAILRSENDPRAAAKQLPLIAVVLITFLLAACAFSIGTTAPLILRAGAILIGLTLAGFGVYSLVRASTRGGLQPEIWASAFARIALPILIVALLVNLKRGPWSGVIVGALLLVSTYARSRLLGCLVAIVALPLLFPTVGQRLLASSQDFLIAGGRSEMWEIGTDLLRTYPLGIGFGNTAVPIEGSQRFLHLFSHTIPHELRHLHSTPLQTFAELGALGFSILLWWLLAILRAARRTPMYTNRGKLSRGIGAGVIAWVIVGFFEYNLGDKEVAMMLFTCVGLLAALSAQATSTEVGQRAP